MRKTIAPSREIVNVLLRRDHALFGNEFVPYFQDVYDHTVRVIDTLDTYRDLLASALDAHLSIVSNDVSQTVKKMTAVTAILMVNALIAGIYGMNFDDHARAALGVRLRLGTGPHGARLRRPLGPVPADPLVVSGAARLLAGPCRCSTAAWPTPAWAQERDSLSDAERRADPEPARRRSARRRLRRPLGHSLDRGRVRTRHRRPSHLRPGPPTARPLAVVFLAGYGSDLASASAAVRAAATALAPRNPKIAFVSYSYTGTTFSGCDATPSPYSAFDTAQDIEVSKRILRETLAALKAACNVDRIMIVGHSLGGLIALQALGEQAVPGVSRPGHRR